MSKTVNFRWPADGDCKPYQPALAKALNYDPRTIVKAARVTKIPAFRVDKEANCSHYRLTSTWNPASRVGGKLTVHGPAARHSKAQGGTSALRPPGGVQRR